MQTVPWSTAKLSRYEFGRLMPDLLRNSAAIRRPGRSETEIRDLIPARAALGRECSGREHRFQEEPETCC